MKELRITPDGSITISWRWAPIGGALVRHRAVARGPLQAVAEPVAELVTYPIETVAKSEKGFDRTRQGESLTFLWPASQGSAQLIISPAH